MFIRVCQRVVAISLALCLPAPAQEKGEGSVATADLSASVKKLLRKPRLASAELTLRNGRTESGRIVRVTDEFISLATYPRPLACEDVRLSEVTDVRWLPAPKAPRQPGAASEAASDAVQMVLFGAFVWVPLLVEEPIATLFQRISPPLKPLSGSWNLDGPSHSDLQSTLEFQGHAVTERSSERERGRWPVEQGKLHLNAAGKPDRVASFHLSCGTGLVLGPSSEVLQCTDCNRATAPAVGDWRSGDHWLNLRKDGTFVQQRFDTQQGTFTNTSTTLEIRWDDSIDPGGGPWTGRIEHRHLILRVAGVTRKYHYNAPGLTLDF
jgi:hypothetical protein